MDLLLRRFEGCCFGWEFSWWFEFLFGFGSRSWVVRWDLLEAIFGSSDDLEEMFLLSATLVTSGFTTWFSVVSPKKWFKVSNETGKWKACTNGVAACGCFVSAICRSSVAILACTWPERLGNALVLGCNGSHWQLAVTLGNLGSFISSFFGARSPKMKLHDYDYIMGHTKEHMGLFGGKTPLIDLSLKQRRFKTIVVVSLLNGAKKNNALLKYLQPVRCELLVFMVESFNNFTQNMVRIPSPFQVFSGDFSMVGLHEISLVTWELSGDMP